MKKLLAVSLLFFAGCSHFPPSLENFELFPKPKGNTQIDQKPGNLRTSKPTADMNSGQSLDIAVHVALRNEDELDEFLAETTDPKSSNYGRTLSHEEFAARFLPTKEQLDKVRTALQKQGMFVDPNYRGAVVRARTSVGVAERAFGTRLSRFRNKKGELVHAPATDLQIPEELQIVSVEGLATPPTRVPHYKASRAASPRFAGPYNVAQLRAAYSVPQTATGKGQSIGVLELDGYLASDIAAYARANGINQPKLTNILIDGYDGSVISSDAQVEVTLDIQLINAMAPNADEIRVYSADQTTSATAFSDIWNEIANPTAGDRKLMKYISCSWGSPEDEMSYASVKSQGAIFKQMAAQGQTVFSAAGDSGAYDDGNYLSVDDPAAQYWNVAVGGTSLRTLQNAYASESAWSNGGGGVSRVWRLPPWQSSVVAKATGGSSKTLRNVPDVSLNADPDTGYQIIVNGQYMVIGGTSCAAPMWSGMAALIGEARAAKSLKPFGFLSPALYNVTNQTFDAYHDVRAGNNGYWNAVPGFDNATGLGSFHAANLLEILSKD